MNTRLSSLRFRLHGAALRLETADKTLLLAARALLPGWATAGPEPEAVLVRFNAGEEIKAAWDESAVRRWSRRLLEHHGRVLLSEVLPLPGLQVQAGWESGRLEIEASFLPMPLRHQVLLRLGRRQAALHSALLYYLVVFPMVHYLEAKRGFRLLHAGAVDTSGGGMLLAGLPGSGKSTTALGMLADPGTRLVSENLLLAGEGRVYAVPELIHLSRGSLNLLPVSVRERLEPGGASSYGRNEFSWPAGERRDSTTPRAIFFLGLGGDPGCWPLNPEEALARWLAMEGLAKEIQAYEQFASSLELALPLSRRASPKASVMRSLFERCDAYELWLQPGAALGAVRRAASQALGEAQRSAQSVLEVETE